MNEGQIPASLPEGGRVVAEPREAVMSTENAIFEKYIPEPDQQTLLDGEGAKATWTETGLYVLIRRVDKTDAEKVAGAHREVAVLSNVADPSISPLKEWYDLDSYIYLITEWRPGRTLRKTVQDYGSLSDEKLKIVMTQLFAGIACLFMAGYAHLRLCDETLYLDELSGLTIRGLENVHEYSEEVTEDLYAATNVKYASDIYVAPEVFASITYNARKATLWSVGVTAYFMATGQTEHLSSLGHPSFESLEEPTSRRRKSSVSGKRLSISQQAHIIPYPSTSRLSIISWVRDIVSKMLVLNPYRRAELIEVAAKVPKEIATKDTRPLMELAWLDYKTHVGPLAGLDYSFNNESSASSIYSGISNISESLTGLLSGRRRSSAAATAGGGGETREPGRRRSSIKNFRFG